MTQSTSQITYYAYEKVRIGIRNVDLWRFEAGTLERGNLTNGIFFVFQKYGDKTDKK